MVLSQQVYKNVFKTITANTISEKKKLFYLPQETYLEFSINPRTYTQIHTPTVVQGVGGGWMEPLPGVFDVLQDFETILPLVESL